MLRNTPLVKQKNSQVACTDIASLAMSAFVRTKEISFLHSAGREACNSNQAIVENFTFYADT